MTLSFPEHLIVSDETRHTATNMGTHWVVSWWPGTTLDRNAAITAMTLAEEIEHPRDGVDGNYGYRQWKLIKDLCAELGILPLKAVHLILGDRYKGEQE